MLVTLDIPEDLGGLLTDMPDSPTQAALEGAALEALALEGLRSGRLSNAQARRLLGISSRDAMDGFLKAHGFFLPLTEEDAEADFRTSRAFRGK